MATTTLDQVRTQALRHLAAADFTRALRLQAHILARVPDDIDGRMRVGDICVQLKEVPSAIQIYGCVAYLDVQAGRPLHALVAMRALTDLGEDVAPLRQAIARLYSAGSPRIGRVGARLSPPSPDTVLPPPPEPRKDDLSLALQAAATVAADSRTIAAFPSVFQPVPLLSDLSDAALERLLQCAVVRRLPHGTAVIKQGDPGDAFYFVASGQVRAVKRDAAGNAVELGRLYEGAIFGEMAIIRAEPRLASVEVVGSADVIEFGADAIHAAADELPALAGALERYTRDRLVRNLVSHSPLFAPFGAAERMELLRRFGSVEVAPGDEVLVRGAEVPGLYLVLSGELEALVGEPPFEQVASRLGPGDCFGQAALLSRQAASATVRASRRSSLLWLSREYFDRLVMTVPEVKSYFEALSAERRRLVAESHVEVAADAAEDDPLF